MGKIDLWQSDYFDDKRRFADIFNGALFKGEQIMNAEELEEVDSKLVHHEKSGEVVNVIRDKVYRWKGQPVSICVLENQSYVDYQMIFRVMLEEAVSYIKQQKRVYKKWKESGYRFDMCKAWDDHKESGRQEGRREGEREILKKSLKVLVDSLKKFSLDLEAVYNAVIENDLYKEVTKEQVRDCYYAK